MSTRGNNTNQIRWMPSRLSSFRHSSVLRLNSSVTVAVLVLCTLAIFGGYIVHNKDISLQTVFSKTDVPTWSRPDARWNLPDVLFTDKYSINCPKRCQRTTPTSGQKDGDDRHVYLLIIVHSSMDHFTQRARIRRTWSNESMLTLRTWRRHPATEKVQTDSSIRIETVFVIGQAAPSVVSGGHHVNKSDNTKRAGVNENSSQRHENLQLKLEEEATKNGDLVQGVFVDTYRNLTYKHLTALQWIINYCNNATFIMKTDDDVFVNIFAVIQHLLDIENYRQNTPLSGSDAKQYNHHNSTFNKPTISASQQISNPGFIMCNLFKKSKVKRLGKWAVNDNEVPHTKYPPYCNGIGHIMTPDVPGKLLKQAVAFSSVHGPPFWIEDVYVTGLLVRALSGSVRQFDMSMAYCNLTKMRFLYGHPQEWFKYVITHVKGLDDSGNQNAELFEYSWKRLVHVATNVWTTSVIPRPKQIRPGRLADCYRPIGKIIKKGVKAQCTRLNNNGEIT